MPPPGRKRRLSSAIIGWIFLSTVFDLRSLWTGGFVELLTVVFEWISFLIAKRVLLKSVFFSSHKSKINGFLTAQALRLGLD